MTCVRSASARPDCGSCAARDTRIAALEAELRRQAEQVRELGVQVARLSRALSRNSGNSSMPPSRDDTPGHPPPRKQRRAAQREADKKRKRGKQPGAAGAAMTWAEPDKTRDYHPEGTAPLADRPQMRPRCAETAADALRSPP